MKQFQYKNYEHYVTCQVAAFNRKKNNIWVSPKELDTMINHLLKNINNPCYGICHGVRTGFEVDYLREKLSSCDVIGTEIGPVNHPYIVQMDFHNIKDEWISKFDFIYTNSFDHSNRPEICLEQWGKCLKSNGILYLTWDGHRSKKFTSTDCFFATLKEYIKLLEEYNYKIVEKLKFERSRFILASIKV